MAESELLVIYPEPQMPRWRPFVQPVLALPHMLYTGVLGVGLILASLVVAASVLVTGKVPARLVAFEAMALRQRARTYSYFWLLRSSSPPFATEVGLGDPGDDPLVTLTAADAPSSPGRAAPLVRLVQLVPQGIVLSVLGIAMDLTYPLWVIYAAVKGGFPPAVSRFLAGVEAWVVAYLGYLLFLTDERPTFGPASHRN